MSVEEMDGPASHLLELIFGFSKSKVLFVGLQMGVFDVLKGSGALTAEALAAQLPVPVTAPIEGFERLLKACVGLGLLSFKDGSYDVTNVSRTYLTATSDQSWTGLVEEMNKVEYKLFGGLEFCAKTGQSCWQEVYHTDSNELFTNTYKDKAYTARFMKTMNSIATEEAPGVMGAFDLSKYKTIVDIGGASGTLMLAGLKLYPDLVATVVDLPIVAEIANEEFSGPPYITDPNIRSRISWIPGDFFAAPDEIPDADIYVLSHILHDWEDSKAQSIVEVVYKKLKPGGALLVSEALLNEDTGPMIGHIMDLIMLVRTPGRERTFKQFVTMLEAAGFTDVQFKGPFFNSNAILAHKPLTATE